LTDFQTGLLISVIGLLVTFFALSIFIGVMVLLQKLFPVKTGKKEVNAEEVKPVEIVAPVETGAEEIAAALAAVTYLRSQRAGQLGASLLSGPGPYRTTR
jgi:Na+-transporting methylmalonyl-CoA/oxaloacetate decarboxylase gamma subunit